MSDLDFAWLLYRTRQEPRQLDWNAITEPGCYVHVNLGFLARIFPEDLEGEGALARFDSPITMAKLSSDPRSTVAELRAIARHHGFTVGF